MELLAATPSNAPVSVAPAPVITSPPPSVVSPVVVSEADLFAVEPEAFQRVAAAHAELAAAGYVSADSVESLLPADVPKPVLPENTSVFVDWAGATEVTEIDQLSFEVDVAVRSLRAEAEGPFIRQPTLSVTFLIGIDPNGKPYVAAAPTMDDVLLDNEHVSGLTQVPSDLVAEAEAGHGSVIGGTQLPGGGWSLVVMKPGPDGVTRPVTIYP